MHPKRINCNDNKTVVKNVNGDTSIIKRWRHSLKPVTEKCYSAVLVLDYINVKMDHDSKSVIPMLGDCNYNNITVRMMLFLKPYCLNE